MNSIEFCSLRPTIQELFNQFPVTSWNQRYDFPRLEHQTRGLRIPVKFWDPMKILKGYMKLPQESGFGYKWPKLSEAYEYFHGENRPNKHRAVDDALDAADIIFQAVRKWPILLTRWEDVVFYDM